jgi:outer membrane protein OmpA-like peptidoglycan-associated protein
MKIEFFCGTDARGTADSYARVVQRVCGAALLLALAACAAGDAVRTGEAQAPAVPKTAQPFDIAIDGLTDALIAKAQVPPGTRRSVVIDPLIERATGYQTAATQSVGLRMQHRIQERWPMLEVKPFTIASLAEQPLVMLGSMSGVASAGAIPSSTDKPLVYRIWAVVADLRTDKVIDRQMAWVKADEIDTTPVAFFADSPAWTPDPHAAAYVKTCSSTAGMPVDPVYRRALQTEAIVADAIKLYGAGRYDDALARYRQASTQDEGTQLRVLNGLYLSDWALGRRQAAEQDFGRVVDYGLGQGRLAVKFVFRPASTSFWPDPAISGPYRMWVRQIARRADASGTCLALTGHTSTTGDPAVNDRLSLARAEAVRGRIAANEPDMRRRTSAAGLGSREVLIGTGRDDVTDALDRRVEVKPIKDGSCGT